MSDTRTFETTIDIAVPADAVWQALTSAEELVRWFPTEARVTPGAGGRWMISWDGTWPWSTEIEIWEPGRHLRIVDRESRPYDAEGKAPNTNVAPLPIAIDWHLEAKSGGTRLRLVHSGFGRGAAWDDEYEGVSTGWVLELNGLKHYLERHRGADRHVAWNRIVVAASPDAIWSQLIGPGGLFRDRALVSPAGVAVRPGERYATTLATGDRLEGHVVAIVGTRGLQVTVDGWNDGLYRIWVDKVGDTAAVNSWLTAYGLPKREVTDFSGRMRTEIERVAAAAAVA